MGALARARGPTPRKARRSQQNQIFPGFSAHETEEMKKDHQCGSSVATPARAPWRALAPAFLLLSVACTAMVDGTHPPGDTSSNTSSTSTTGGSTTTTTTALTCDGSPKPGRSPLRRLDLQEYKNTISDLLNVNTDLVDTFPPDEAGLGFTNNADALVVTSLLAEAYMTASTTMATAAVVNNFSTLVTCDPTAIGEDACATQFITQFGARAFRRPLTASEVTTIKGVYTTGRANGAFSDGIELAIEALIQSPPFLYRIEVGTPVAGTPTVAQVSPYEMASRLSYFLIGTMPDAALFDAAAAGKLTEPADIEAQVDRLLQLPQAHNAVAEFHDEWLGISDLAGVTKDATLYPQWNTTIDAEQRQEAATFVDQTFWNDGHLETLLTAPYSYLNKDLATFYGVSGPTDTSFVKTDFPAGQRAGILTQGALLGVLAKANQTSPVLRGKFVREMLLCQQLSPPPPNVVITPPDIAPNTTTRQRYTEHSANPTCATCHQLMDQIGFGFENFDPVGNYRTTDQNLPVDASGNLVQTDVDGSFTGAVALAAKLAQSPEVRQCIVKQWFRYANGRAETDADQCTLNTLNQDFENDMHDMRDLRVKISTSDAFRFRSVDGGGS
jgi:Protein of unknown function (DUF1592)/Protein of unknown function (DUF1588)/Protein of unknown function (DUF1595)/Protein of unknown function (DUF1587)/Protein of unknown function (DUF1585)